MSDTELKLLEGMQSGLDALSSIHIAMRAGDGGACVEKRLSRAANAFFAGIRALGYNFDAFAGEIRKEDPR